MDIGLKYLRKNIESDITVRLQAITQDKIFHTGGDQGQRQLQVNRGSAIPRMQELCVHCYRLTLLEGEAGGIDHDAKELRVPGLHEDTEFDGCRIEQ